MIHGRFDLFESFRSYPSFRILQKHLATSLLSNIDQKIRLNWGKKFQTSLQLISPFLSQIPVFISFRPCYTHWFRLLSDTGIDIDAYLILPEPAQWLIFPSGFGFKLKWVVNISSTGQKNYISNGWVKTKYLTHSERQWLLLRCYFLKKSLTSTLYFNDQTAALGFSFGETVPEWGGAALCLQLNKYSSKFHKGWKRILVMLHQCLTLAHWPIVVV